MLFVWFLTEARRRQKSQQDEMGEAQPVEQTDPATIQPDDPKPAEKPDVPEMAVPPMGPPGMLPPQGAMMGGPPGAMMGPPPNSLAAGLMPPPGQMGQMGPMGPFPGQPLPGSLMLVRGPAAAWEERPHTPAPAGMHTPPAPLDDKEPQHIYRPGPAVFRAFNALNKNLPRTKFSTLEGILMT